MTVVDIRSALLVLRDLLQALPDSSGVVGSELFLKFTLVLKIGRLLHLALSYPEFLPAAADECRLLLRQFLLDALVNHGLSLLYRVTFFVFVHTSSHQLM